MTRSMTAFARQQAEYSWGTLVWEVRSVNQRFLEPNFRLPESFRELEGKLREQLRNSLSRGKVECTLRFTPAAQVQDQLQVNGTIVQQVHAACMDVKKQFAETAPVNPLDILRWPGVLSEHQLDMKAVLNEARSLFKTTLTELQDSRAREGEKLEAMIQQRIDAISAVVIQVREKMPLILQRQRENILTRFEDAKIELDPGRLEQELVMLAQKADVDEELDRLDAHVSEVQSVLLRKEPIGRRLDFLMQELNREANTLSSKSIVVETTQCAVELKVLIEQMREQIQNIE